MALDDKILEFDITPNRGDCLSIKGFTRELSAILNKPIKKKTNVPTIIQHEVNYCLSLFEKLALLQRGCHFSKTNEMSTKGGLRVSIFYQCIQYPISNMEIEP